MVIWTLLITLSILGQVGSKETYYSKKSIKQFLEVYNTAAGEQTNTVIHKNWNLYTDINKYNMDELVKQQSIITNFESDMRTVALQLIPAAVCLDYMRQLRKIADIGTPDQPNVTKVEELATIVQEMKYIYSSAKVCLAPDKCLPLDPDIISLLAASRDHDTLETLWVGWRNETGRKMKDLYTKSVQLSNEAAQYLGYKDTGEKWRAVYESDTFVDDVQDLFDQVRPLYEQLHGYVRRRLRQVYGESKFPASGHIPAHLLGNTWAQDWGNVMDLVKPFPNKTSMDVTPEMVRQNYMVDKIFRTAEDFFVSLGFDKMVPSFWTLSMLEKPNDGRQVVCRPSAWDFFNQRDFRIKMCTDINQDNLMTVYHEMGQLQYFMQYKDQPFIYREGANPGFQRAVGDVVILSVQTPEHMKKLGLINEVPEDNETDINFLMSMALQKVALLPFGYLIDLWRWSVFSGKTTPETYNKDWWDLRCHLQGISPPVSRSEDDFDPGAKIHVPDAAPYIRYFVSYILQFQFHQAACQAAGYVGPLHRCDIYNNTKAGEKLRAMMKLGSSQPWPEALKQITGQKKMNAEPLLEYFRPLLDFLRAENGNDYGWDHNCSVPTK